MLFVVLQATQPVVKFLSFATIFFLLEILYSNSAIKNNILNTLFITEILKKFYIFNKISKNE